MNLKKYFIIISNNKMDPRERLLRRQRLIQERNRAVNRRVLQADDLVRVTAGQVGYRNQVAQLNNQIAEEQNRDVRKRLTSERNAIAKKDRFITSRQIRDTQRQRDSIRSSINPPNGLPITGNIYDYRNFFRSPEIQGNTFTIRIRYREDEEKEDKFVVGRFVNFNYDRDNGTLFNLFWEDSARILPNISQVIIVRDADIPKIKVPAGSTKYEQYFRENPTSTCVLDALQQAIPKNKNDEYSKNNKTIYNKLEKLKKTYPNGMTKKDISLLPDLIKVTIELHTLLPVLCPEIFKCNDPDVRMRVKLINSRPHHVDYYQGKDEIIYINPEDWNEVKDKYLKSDDFLYFVNRDEIVNKIITKEGSFVLQTNSFDIYTHFHNQYQYENCISQEEEYSLPFNGVMPIKLQEFIPTMYEYDLVEAYNQYPYYDCGYIIKQEHGTFPSMIIPELIELYDNDFTTVTFDIIITNKDPLLDLFNVPDVILNIPVWCINMYHSSEYYLTSFTVHHKYKLNVNRVLKEFNLFYKGDDKKKKWKEIYTKMYGVTGMKYIDKKWDIKGTDDEDFFNYCLEKLNENDNHIHKYKVRKTDNKNYFITTQIKNRFYCPLILHHRNMYCIHSLLTLISDNDVKTSDIILKTLDSIVLSTKLILPPTEYIKEKIKTPNDFKNYIDKTDIQINFIDDLPIKYTKIQDLLIPEPRLTYHIGAGGFGKTTDLLRQYPNAILVMPTIELIKEKKSQYPDRRIMTYHKMNGWNTRTGVPYANNDGVQWRGVYIIDEITMLKPEQIEEIIKLHPHSQLHFLGDIDGDCGIPYQCSMSENIPKYNPVNCINHDKIDYRSKDEKTKAFKREIRSSMKPLLSAKQCYNIYVMVEICKEYNIKITEDVDNTLPMLTASRWLTDYYSTELKMNSLNAHRVQGKTLSEKYQIDLTTATLQKFYTCLSRCNSIDQIVLINSSDRMDDRWKNRSKYLKITNKGDIDEYNEMEENKIKMYE
jgi:hypothetical protein